ncbi:DUF4041 domain-containing protein [Clostridium beijerinckii]|uniref:DUF4041 domain-containing protein n=1 Tax=Clostridium beijerinckii TaxID=1520 RepID=UPI00047AEFE7|nr:DUF4041 domain-containing protein [Clostridium beijerinckii]
MLIFIILALIITIFVIKKSKTKLQKTLTETVSNLNKTIREKDDIISELSKYQDIIDVQSKCDELLSNAQNKAELIKKRYETLLTFAQIEAEKIKEKSLSAKKQMDEQIKIRKVEYDNILSTAVEQSKQIISDANIKAEEIAGDAYKALNNHKELEQKAKAMKNVIEGYGNKYIIPTHGILDELADDFGYTEAGIELKKSRQKSKFMVENGLTAKCDYVENNRKTTAINFVTDAFNGKVDTILSTVKSTNYGILKQKITDSYILVNNLGEAFRNAVITPEYLQARLDELKWAVAAFELKEKEKEEQRLIKEQIREEERARRDYEKAIKEAAKEEEMLKKLMEKAQLQLQEANDQQKAEYESKLIDLQKKLQEAEEKNQRALSMAQQTKSGHVYIISNVGSFGEDVYKIGMTRRLDPLDRVKELGDASVPFTFDVHSMIFSDDAPKLETELHKIFNKNQVNKVNPKKEFFKVNINDVKSQIEKMGIQSKWTMLAEAKEYRESLAIENEMKNSEEFAS